MKYYWMESTTLILNRGTWFFQGGIYDNLNNIFKLKLEIIIMLELYETLSTYGNDIHNWSFCDIICVATCECWTLIILKRFASSTYIKLWRQYSFTWILYSSFLWIKCFPPEGKGVSWDPVYMKTHIWENWNLQESGESPSQCYKNRKGLLWVDITMSWDDKKRSCWRCSQGV